MNKTWQLPMIALAVALVVGLSITLWVSSSREGPNLAAQTEGNLPAAPQTQTATPTVSPVTTMEPLKEAVVVEPVPSGTEPAPSAKATKPLSTTTKPQRKAQISSPPEVKKKAPPQPRFDPLSDGR